MEDQYTSKNEPKSQLGRKLYMRDDLAPLLKCKIIITIEDRMEKHYLQKLNSTNSVKLTDNMPLESIEKVFGKNWTFNPPDPEFSFWSSSSSNQEDAKQPIGSREESVSNISRSKL